MKTCLNRVLSNSIKLGIVASYDLRHLTMAIVLAFIAVIFFENHALALGTPEQVYEDYLYVHCLKESFKTVERDAVDHTRAFDPETGRNFVYDKDKEDWIDTKTGEVICPKNDPSKKAAVYEDYLYVNCLKEAFKTVERDAVDHGRAYDPDTGRNFFFDKDKKAWIDSKTGEQVCPQPTTSKPNDAVKTASADSGVVPAPDKSYYNLFKMTPRELRRPISTATDFGALGAHTVDAGAFVADLGFGYGYSSRSFGTADRTDESWNLGHTWLKAGICNHLDFEVGLPLWQIHTQTLKDPTGHDSNTSDGFGDFETRLKYTLWGNDTGPDTFAIAGTVKYPTTTYDKSRDDYEGGLTALFEYLCPCDLDMRINSGFRLSDDPCWESCFDNRISFTHPLILIDNLYAQASFNSTFSTAKNSTWDGEFQTGLIYQPTPDCQIYLGTSFGVNGSADDYGLRLDVAYRF